MIDQLFRLLQKPVLWQRSAEPFWDDEHISKGMLEAHLNPDWEAASRKHSFIDRIQKCRLIKYQAAHTFCSHGHINPFLSAKTNIPTPAAIDRFKESTSTDCGIFMLNPADLHWSGSPDASFPNSSENSGACGQLPWLSESLPSGMNGKHAWSGNAFLYASKDAKF